MNHTVLDNAAKKWLKSHFREHVRFEEPMFAHTSFKVGGTAEAYVVPQSLKQLIELVTWAYNNGHPYLIVGDGTNLLVKDRGIAGITIVLRRCLKKITITQKKDDRVTVNAKAGVRLSRLCSFAIENGLKGMNFALGIPGTVGGGIMMNAGTAAGWMDDVLSSISIMRPSGEREVIPRQKLNFSYRSLNWRAGEKKFNRGYPIIIEGFFKLSPEDTRALRQEAKALLHLRKQRQPTGLPSAGCFFKNPPTGKTAGELIERAGLKGVEIGGAAVSTRHANFIVNTGNASAADILKLADLIRKTVSTKFNVALENEVKVVGN